MYFKIYRFATRCIRGRRKREDEEVAGEEKDKAKMTKKTSEQTVYRERGRGEERKRRKRGGGDR